MSNSTDALNVRRRHFVGLAGTAICAVAMVSALPRKARAADLPHVGNEDPTAKALNYTEDATKASAPHQAGQTCSNCNFYQGGAAAFGPCQLFPGKAVASKGWCSGYAKKA